MLLLIEAGWATINFVKHGSYPHILPQRGGIDNGLPCDLEDPYTKVSLAETFDIGLDLSILDFSIKPSYIFFSEVSGNVSM